MGPPFLWYARGVSLVSRGFVNNENSLEGSKDFGAHMDCRARNSGARDNAAGAARAVREERSDDCNAGRRETAYGDLHTEECQGSAADFSGAHAIRNFR